MSGSHLGSRHDFEATGKHFRVPDGRRLPVPATPTSIGARIYYDTGTIARQLA